ncbi:MAG: hypothetical protein JWO76_371 [Nocardioides sp.]|nr:hypothetical protein [Nocardioides sp.]
MTSEVNDQARRHDPVYDEIHASPEFNDLRRRYRRFAFPATVAFLAWYLLYVVMSNWAHDFMSTKVPGLGHVNVALVFGLLQFLTTFLIAWFYASYMAKNVDPIARDLEARWNRDAEKGIR